MGRKYQFSVNEMNILYILWKAEKPLLVSEIADRGINLSTARATIRSMYEKNLVEVTGRAKTGTVFGRCYQPAIGLREYEMDKLLNDFREKLCQDITISDLAKAYLDDLDDESQQKEIRELERIINEKSAKLL